MKHLYQLLAFALLCTMAVSCSDEASDDGGSNSEELVLSFEGTAYDGTELKIESGALNAIYRDEEFTLKDTSTGSPEEVRWTFYDSDAEIYKTLTAVDGVATYTFTEDGVYGLKMFAVKDGVTESSITYSKFCSVERNPNYSTAEVPVEDDKEWGIYPINYVETETGKKWTLLDLSDEFNDSCAPSSTETYMNGKWKNYYPSNWSGPAPTYWQHDRVWIADSKMKIIADRPSDPVQRDVGDGVYMDGTYTGCASATEQVQYPVYVETYVKLSNSTMASDVWMLSDDATQEIDICEAYGSDRSISSYFDKYRLHLSHHVFIRDPFTDYQPQDAGTHYEDGLGTIWRDDYHRIGVFWEDPTHLYYYVDGKLARVTNNDSGTIMIDPNNYTDGENLSKKLNVIINMEDQTWRATSGYSPTEAELENTENMTFNVEWIRAYQLVDL